MQKIEKVLINTALPEERLKQNILDARKYCVTPISELPDWREGRAVAIVGGGPSLAKNLEALRKESTIIACGSVHDYLQQQNIISDYCLVCDPDPIMADYLQLNTYNTKYLVASQCDQKVFEYLRGTKVYLWDCLGPTEFNNEMFDAERINAIPGGCTVGTRAILCAIGMGYKKIRLYGFDSCIDENKHHAYEFNDPELEQLGTITELKLEHPESDKTFKVAGYMMAQIFDFQEILKTYGNTLQIEVIGDGVLAEIMRLGHVEAKKHLEKVN